MIITTLPTKTAVSEIVKFYRLMRSEKSNGRPLPFRNFADELAEIVEPLGGGVSHQSIKNWEDKTFFPSKFHLVQMLTHSAVTDWQHSFAADVLAALEPETYLPITEFAKEVIKEHLGA